MEIPWPNDSELNDNKFYNRIEDIELITNLITSNPNSTPTLLLTGIRGVGKTTLMKNIKNKLSKDYLVIYIDISKSDAYQEKELNRFTFMELFYDSVIDSCKNKGLKTIDKTIRKIFKINNIKMEGIINYKNEIKGVIIFFDEFQILKDLENIDSFLWYIRSNIQEQKHATYILSGSMSIKDEFIEQIAGNTGAFGGRILTLEIKAFSYETTKRYMKEKAPELNFTESGIKQFYTCTKGIPSYINTFANILPQNKKWMMML